MKKLSTSLLGFYLILGLFLPCLSLGAQGSANFGYADRTGASVGLGIAKTNFVSLAIKLPQMRGNVVTGLSVFLAGEAGQQGSSHSVFIASTKDNKIKFIQDVQLRAGWNEINLNAPFTLSDDAAYLVGYQLHARTSLKPLGFEQGNHRRISGVNFMEVGGAYTEVGDKTEFEEVSEQGVANALIFAKVQDHQGVLNQVACVVGGVFASEELTPNQPSEVTISVRNIGQQPISSLEFITQYSAQAKQNFTVSSLAIAPGSTAQIKLRPTAPARGLGSFYTVIPEVNKQKQILGRSVFFMPYRVQTPNGSWARNSVLIEKFTSETCVNCPAQEEPLKKLVNQMRQDGMEVSIIAHHAGTEGDIFTLRGSENIALYAYGSTQFAPALMINRVPDDHYVRNLAGTYPNRVTKYQKARNIAQVVRLDNVATKMKDGKLSILVEGQTGYIDSENFFLTAVITEDNIKAINQQGVKGDFYHNYLLRKFLTPEFGVLVPVKADGSFSYEIEDVTYDSSWKTEHMKVVVFLHKQMRVRDLNERQVYAAKTATWSTLTAIDGPEELAGITVLAYDGYLKLSGEVDSIAVYDLTGQLVARDHSQRLRPGVYIVRLGLQGKYSTHKVIVQ